MNDRLGQVWSLETLSESSAIFVVVGKSWRAGFDHHNPDSVLWIHPCMNLTTGEQFESREWTDEAWEERHSMTRIA